MYDKGFNGLLKMDITDNPNTPAYQIEPYDYYVSDYFLAKSLQHVLKYADDEILCEVAVDEATKCFRTDKELIIRHINSITKKE